MIYLGTRKLYSRKMKNLQFHILTWVNLQKYSNCGKNLQKNQYTVILCMVHVGQTLPNILVKSTCGKIMNRNKKMRCYFQERSYFRVIEGGRITTGQLPIRKQTQGTDTPWCLCIYIHSNCFTFMLMMQSFVCICYLIKTT